MRSSSRLPSYVELAVATVASNPPFAPTAATPPVPHPDAETSAKILGDMSLGFVRLRRALEEAQRAAAAR